MYNYIRTYKPISYRDDEIGVVDEITVNNSKIDDLINALKITKEKYGDVPLSIPNEWDHRIGKIVITQSVGEEALYAEITHT